MNILINEFINTIINIMLFSLIPFIWYIISRRTMHGFFKWVGIFRSKDINKKEISLIFIGMYTISVVILICSVYLLPTTRSTEIFSTLPGPFYMGIYLLLYGIKTGVAEEIFFRGFIAKRVIHRWGFMRGNIIQALCFAVVHIQALSKMGLLDTGIRIFNAGIVGLTFGFIMEKKSKGSILPCIIAHMIYNMISSLLLYIVL